MADALHYAGIAVTSSIPQRQVTSRLMDVLALAADSARQEIVASVATPTGYELLGLDPATLATRWTLPLPAAASRLVVADDASMLYALLPVAAAVVQVHLPSRTIKRQFATADGLAPLSAAVRPGAPETLVITTGRPQFVSPFDRAQVYDSGVPRPRYVGFSGGPDNAVPIAVPEIAFTDAQQLAGYDNQTTGCGIVRLTLTDDGLVASAYDQFKLVSLSDCFFARLSAPVPGRLLTSGGRNVDPVTLEDLDYLYGASDLDYGDGVFAAGRNSFVRLQFASQAPLDGRHHVDLWEYDAGARRVLRTRAALASSTVALPNKGYNPLTAVAGSVTLGDSRLVVAVYDVTQQAQGSLLSVDLADLPAHAPPLPQPDTAQGARYTGWSLQLPALDIAFDADANRLVAALPADAGPDGNALAIIHPDTGTVERLIPLPGEPLVTRVSAAGSVAYVILRGMFRVVMVDLKTGMLSASLRSKARTLAVKPDDNKTIALLEFDDHYVFSLKKMTNFVAAPLMLTDQSLQSSTAAVGWIAPLGNDRLVAVTDTGEAWRLAWTPDGLRREAFWSSASAGTNPHLDFGRLCFGLVGQVLDPTTATLKGAVSSYGDCAIASATQVIFGDRDSLPSNNYRMRWFDEPQVPAADLAWQVSDTLKIFDARYETTYGPLLQRKLLLAGPQRLIHHGVGLTDPSVGVIYGIRRK